MIIFDLDGTLANCSHRRHFVDRRLVPHTVIDGSAFRQYPKWYDEATDSCIIPCDINWKPDYAAFSELCDKDKPIKPVIDLLDSYLLSEDYSLGWVQIWSGRCESVREKTIDWLIQHTHLDDTRDDCGIILKMRPIGDSTPDDQLKEKWLDEFIDSNEYVKIVVTQRRSPFEMVFDSNPKALRMWQKRGIFTFDVGQGMGEF